MLTWNDTEWSSREIRDGNGARKDKDIREDNKAMGQRGESGFSTESSHKGIGEKVGNNSKENAVTYMEITIEENNCKDRDLRGKYGNMNELSEKEEWNVMWIASSGEKEEGVRDEGMNEKLVINEGGQKQKRSQKNKGRGRGKYKRCRGWKRLVQEVRKRVHFSEVNRDRLVTRESGKRKQDCNKENGSC